jgi:D-serine deaminase-like pyridoxal phosphate-dependent protein
VGGAPTSFLRVVLAMSDALHDCATPHLVVDLDVLDANIAAMAAFARDRGVALRPHAKTHKSPDVARRQLAAGATGLTLATVAEAEVFAAAGCTDLFLAYPLWVDAARGARLRSLTGRTRLTVGVDSVEGARALATHAPGTVVLVEVDSGHHRSGIAPDDAGALAEVAQHAGLDVRGVFTFPGHSYSPGVARDVAKQESAALRTAATSLSRHGIEPVVVSGGSTPSVPDMDADVLTELRPGVYVFGDAQQWELGTTQPSDIALACLATVVSHAGGRVVLDSGSKALGADRPPWATGWGRLLDHPDRTIGLLSEHHAVVDWDDQPLPRLGSRLRVVPNHVCNAVNLADELVVVRGGTVVDVWPVAARGANT